MVKRLVRPIVSTLALSACRGHLRLLLATFPLPGRTLRQAGDECVLYPSERCRRLKRDAEREQWRHVTEKDRVLDLLGDILFELRLGDAPAVVLHVPREAGDHLPGVETGQASERLREIEGIPPLLALVECPPRTQKCSRVLISTLSLSGVTGRVSDSNR